MAKKITSDTLINPSQSWSGKVHDGYAASSDALPFSGDQVETFIKNQIKGKNGYVVIENGYILCFPDEETYQAFITPDNELYQDEQKCLICPKAQLPTTGGETKSDALAIYGIDATQYYTKGASTITLKFKVRNIVDGETNTDINVLITDANGVSLYNRLRPAADSDGYYTAVIPGSSLKNIENTSDIITLTVTRSGEEREVSRNITIRCVDLSLSLDKDFNLGIINPSSINYVPIFTLPQGVTALKLCIDLYAPSNELFKHFETANLVTNNLASVALDWSNMPMSGVYMAKAYLDMGNGMVQSNVVKSRLMGVLDAQKDGTTLVAIEPIGTATLYENIVPRIYVYNAGQETAHVRISLNNGNKTELSIPTGRIYIDYTATVEDSNNTLRVEVIDSNSNVVAVGEDTFTATGDFNWKTIAGYRYNLVAKSRSNSELPTPAHWGYVNSLTDGKWKGSTQELTKFTNVKFNDYGSGWTTNSLHLVGGGKAAINYPIFYDTTAYSERNNGGGVLAKGRTLRIRFKTNNVVDNSKHLIECWDGKVGFWVTADTIYVKMGEGGEITTDPWNGDQATQNNRHFDANTPIDLAITIQPYYNASFQETGHFATMYVNGQFAGEAKLTNTSLTQSSAMPITLNSEGADLDVYEITAYESCLSSFQILQNFVMGLGSLADMKTEFQKNQCYTGDGTVNFNETFKYCLWLSQRAGDTVDGTLNILVNTYTFPPEETSTDTIAPGQQELELFFFKNGKVDTDRSIKYVGKNNKDLRVRIQGTSTAFEYRKNMRYDVKGTVQVYRWSEEAYKAAGSLNPSDGWVYKEDRTKLNLYIRGNKTTENACKILTTKTNYNESTSTRNLPMAKWSEDAMRYLSQHGYPDILTPPQKADSKIRQCIDGIPAVQFTHNVGSSDYQFSGKIDLITDKKNASVFGFSDGGHDYSAEFRNGNTDICDFRCPDLTKAGKYLDGTFADTKKGYDCFEYRWPDLDTGDVYYGDGYIGKDSALQRLFDFVFNCHPDFIGYKSKNGQLSSTNATLTIKGVSGYPDNKDNRLKKFKEELKYYVNVDSFTFNAFASRVHLWTDQRGKNQFYTHFDGDEVVADFDDDINVKGTKYEVLRLLPYDIDTSERGDNASRLRYDFTRLYGDADVYNDTVSVVTAAKEWLASQDVVEDKDKFINERILNKHSALYELLDATMQETYADMFAQLSKGGLLGEESIRKYAFTNEVDCYNSVIYNADTAYKYMASGTYADQQKAHGSAKEDLLWWAKGRMYFMGGENGAGDFTSSTLDGVMCMDSVLDDWNRANRISNDTITISIKSQYRNYIDASFGTGGSAQRAYAEDPTKYYNVKLNTTGISNEDSGRFHLYGQRYYADIADFSHLYIQSITNWGGCTALRMLKFGDKDERYKNPVLQSIKQKGDTFGAEVVDLRNCTAYADSDFRAFPSMKELYLTGCSALLEMQLPATNNLEKLYAPKNLTKIELNGLDKLTEFDVEGIGNAEAISVKGCPDVVVESVINRLTDYYK
jgi:hypothetical protein